MKNTFEYIHTNGAGFLFPSSFSEFCYHEWKILDSGYACCKICGIDHDCNRGHCPEVYGDATEKICSITGCVTCEGEMREERDAFDRVGHVQDDSKNTYDTTFYSFDDRKIDEPVRKKHRKHKQYSTLGSSDTMEQDKFYILAAFENNVNKLAECIEGVVTEILLSEKTKICFMQEIKRNENKMMCIFSKLLRECAHNKTCMRPNMCDIVSHIFFHMKKGRFQYTEMNEDRYRQIRKLINQCTTSITNLLMTYGRQRVARQIQNQSRCREFICSMLYLMRMGITYQNRQLLPKLEGLNEYLPLQVLLPVVFKIRAKSITEGENIIKLDIRRLPLI
jgi:hypothetical protein